MTEGACQFCQTF